MRPLQVSILLRIKGILLLLFSYFAALFLCYYKQNIDSDMVRAAITPLAECQRIAVIWMKDFFNIQGDHSPDSNDIMLQIMLKSNAYDKYCESMTPRRCVSESKFKELWNVLFPHVQMRPNCDIPGKCHICYEIDRQRRQEHDAHTSIMLQEAHLLHRGGMFHLEREG